MPDPSWLVHWSPSKILLIVTLLCVSAFASSSETAFFSLNRFQLRRIKERYRSAYARIRTLLSRPSRLLVLILLLNELVNLTFSSLIAHGLEKTLTGRISPERMYVAVTFMTMAITLPVLLLFGEITPKIIAAKMNRIVSMLNSMVLIVLYRAFFPLLWLLDTAIGFVLRSLKAEGRDHLSKTMTVLNEDDILLLTEEGHREGTVEPSEQKLIKNVFEFDDSTVSEVMTPIHQAFCVADSALVSDVMSEIRAQKYSRVPVFHKNRRHIVGVLYVKDLLALRNHPGLHEIEVKSLMAKPMYVSPSTRLSVLFRRFKESKTHMAVVASDQTRYDELAVGVVTMEDLLESIFGEISDERDVP